MRYLMIALLVLMQLPTAPQADSWIAVRMLTVRSQNGMFMATITPATTIPANVPCIARLFRLDSLGSSSLVWRAELINEVRPYSAIVTNSGQLVTFDEWGNVGGRNALTVYGMQGVLLRTYDLEDLATQSLIHKMLSSASSIWWRDTAFVEKDTNFLCVMVSTDVQLDMSLPRLQQRCAIREMKVDLADGLVVKPIDSTPAGIAYWTTVKFP